MAKKGTVKNQHFVPRCLLRRFSQNAKTTSVFVIGSGTFVETAGIRTQCAADYYYGHDQTIENNLGHLEGAFSGAIGDALPKTLEALTKEQLETVRAFMHIQAERTPHAATGYRKMYEEMGRQLSAAYTRVNNLEPHDSREAERFADAQMPIPGAHTVELATRHQDAISDLEVKFIFGEGFMISDHPTLALNPWRDAHSKFSRWPTSGGLLTKGFVYLMPIASTCVAIAYDSGTYQVGDDDSRIVHVAPNDQFLLNGLQTINATQLLFDTGALAPLDLVAALDFRNRIRAAEGAGRLQLHMPAHAFSFLTVVDANTYDDWDLAMLPGREASALSAAAHQSEPPVVD